MSLCQAKKKVFCKRYGLFSERSVLLSELSVLLSKRGKCIIFNHSWFNSSTLWVENNYVCKANSI